jgi:outer membrane lipoprotein-sorting protein
MLMVRSFRTGFAVALAAALSAGVARAQTVDEVIAKNLQARGGVEKLKAMNSAKVTGEVEQQGAKIHIVTWAKRPNMMRREMDVTPPPPTPGRVSVPGTTGPMKQIMAFDGSTVWVINSMLGDSPQQITGPQADMAKGDADFDSILLDYKAKGHTIELVGTEPVNGKPAYHLKITKKNGLIQQYYLDVETGLEVRTGTTVEQSGVRTEVTTDMSNYQTVDGLRMPFTMKQSVNGTPVAEVTISKWEVNVPIDDQLFRMPVKQ